ncbi:hypothetical protein GPJ56_002474 [Histomonas meleagridis]|uniref:uncharacterized protein n=1 Tax=Histomonas meleagridis TaxID=135588 RepID=UPI00355A6F20|nr:hypothetical protein GPJ56_002474 [Histomonas meleagridis]KAH0798241.1 hypothetical protein GO595_008929 [Histomonas meleagridis]
MLKSDEIMIYIGRNSYPAYAIYCMQRSQCVMVDSFENNFLRPIHMSGIHLHNLFGAPRYYPHAPKSALAAEPIIQDLSFLKSTKVYALYSQNMIVAASSWFWKMTKQELHAVDLLTRNSEAPFTDQIFIRESGTIERVVVVLLFKTMKLAIVCGSTFNLLNEISSSIPQSLRQHISSLEQIEKVPPVVNKQNGIVGWIVLDLATHRFFGDVPEKHEKKFITMICKAYDIQDKTNRICDISVRLEDHMFFFMPQVLVKNDFFSRSPHFWSIFLLHDFKKSVEEMRHFAEKFMLSLIQYVEPVNDFKVEDFVVVNKVS